MNKLWILVNNNKSILSTTNPPYNQLVIIWRPMYGGQRDIYGNSVLSAQSNL